MTAHLTKAEAAALGLSGGSRGSKPKNVASKTKKSRAKPDKFESICATCDEHTFGETAQERHAAETGHARFCCPLD